MKSKWLNFKYFSSFIDLIFYLKSKIYNFQKYGFKELH